MMVHTFTCLAEKRPFCSQLGIEGHIDKSELSHRKRTKKLPVDVRPTIGFDTLMT